MHAHVIPGTHILLVDDAHRQVFCPMAVLQELLIVCRPQAETSGRSFQVDWYQAVVFCSPGLVGSLRQASFIAGEVHREVGEACTGILLVVVFRHVVQVDPHLVQRISMEMPVIRLVAGYIVRPCQHLVESVGHVEVQRVLRGLHEAVHGDFAAGFQRALVHVVGGGGHTVKFHNEAHVKVFTDAVFGGRYLLQKFLRVVAVLVVHQFFVVVGRHAVGIQFHDDL